MIKYVILILISGMAGAWATPKLHPWHNVFPNLGETFMGTNSLYYAGASVATVGMISSGWDRKAQNWFQKENPIGDQIGYGMVVAGWFWQVLPATAMYFGGMGFDDYETMAAGSAGIQAVAVVGAVTMTLKYVTGRRQPLKNGVHEFYGPSGHKRSDRPDDFQFFNHNIQNESLRIAWPSGHTSSTVAFVSAMAAFYPDKLWIKLIGYPASFFMAAAMVDYDAHWSSDVIAGALIGHVIGYTIGKNFRNSFDAVTDNARNSRGEKILPSRFALVPSQDKIEGRIEVLF